MKKTPASAGADILATQGLRVNNTTGEGSAVLLH